MESYMELNWLQQDLLLRNQIFHNLILDQEIFLEQKKLECLQLKELDLQI
nr:MAG TPA: hypothetical protein [Bacteriophage sp.]